MTEEPNRQEAEYQAIENTIFHDLPAYAEYINIQDEDEGSTIGILTVSPITSIEQRLTDLLKAHHDAERIILRGHSWTSVSMMGGLNYTSIEDGDHIERAAYIEITHIY